jgi:hypothetical protein
MEPHKSKAFDFSAELTKQLITLATAIITLTVTFIKDVAGDFDRSYSWMLIAIWIAFFLSILFGIFTLGALTGNLDPMPSKPRTKEGSEQTESIVDTQPILTINSKNILSSSRLQSVTFLIGLILACVYGYYLAIGPQQNDHSDSYMVVRRSTLGTDTTVHVDTLYLKKD